MSQINPGSLDVFKPQICQQYHLKNTEMQTKNVILAYGVIFYTFVQNILQGAFQCEINIAFCALKLLPILTFFFFTGNFQLGRSNKRGQCAQTDKAHTKLLHIKQRKLRLIVAF